MSCLNILTTYDFDIIVDKLPNINLFAQTFTIPSISGSPPKQHTPLNPVNRSFDHVEFDSFQIGFMIDAAMNNYLTIFEWMMGIGFPVDTQQRIDYTAGDTRLTSDITVHLKNAHGKAIIAFTFRNAIPTSLDQVSLNKQQTAARPVTSNITFAYDSVDIRRLP